MNFQLSDAEVIESFHSLLVTSLAQAKAERLLDSETLSSAEADLMICGPALCLYFAALRSTTTPPSVPLPRIDRRQPPATLSATNCPPTFVSMLRVWSSLVPRIQAFIPDHQHDLARIICGLDPISQPLNMELNRVAAEIRSIAIEISQRRSFQERYASDLQDAIDHGEPRGSSGRSKITASFRPPPTYDEASSTSSTPSPSSSPGNTTLSLPVPADLPPQSPNRLSALNIPQPPSPSHSQQPPSSTSIKSINALETIRETLYASLADVIASTPSIRRLLKTDPSMAYYSGVALAILNVAQTSVTPSGAIKGVLGREITLADCPKDFRPLMRELVSIGEHARQMADEDEENAIKLVSQSRTPPEPRLDRTRKMIERGVGYEEDPNDRTPQTEEGRRSIEGRSIQFTNRINALALTMSKLNTFRQRQDEVFKVLAGSV